MRPIEASLYTVVMEIRVAMRRARDGGYEGIAQELDVIKQLVLDLKRRCDGI